jgi:hypothetical protein
MGIMEIQIAPAVEGKQILSGELCLGFFGEESKCTEECRVTMKITVVEKTLDVGVAVA